MTIIWTTYVSLAKASKFNILTSLIKSIHMQTCRGTAHSLFPINNSHKYNFGAGIHLSIKIIPLQMDTSKIACSKWTCACGFEENKN